MDAKLKHLEFIQGVINRLATNSFRLKGWAVVLVAALLAVLVREGRLEFATIALAPVVFFWGLDGYYLWQERLYRALYDDVRVRDDTDTDFSMDVIAFRIDYGRTWLGATLSTTLVFFYSALALTVGLVMAVG